MYLENPGIENLSHKAMLLNEIMRAPREVAAICPGSARLGDTMASLIGPGDGWVVELGGETGVITESLLRSGIPSRKLLVIEKSATFASLLLRRFPHVEVIHADAADMPPVLRQVAVKAVVSCLPLGSLPDDVAARIAGTWARSLAAGGRVIQFTNSPFAGSAWRDAGLTRIGSDIVLANPAPARVQVFARS